jgi:hypothetical protein
MSTKVTLTGNLLVKQNLDFDLLQKHPKMMDAIFTDLYSISNQLVTETAAMK